MNKSNLINAVFDEVAIPKKDCEEVINTMLKIMAEELSKGNKLNLSGFGAFEVMRTSKKKITNLHTKVQMLVPERNTVKFRSSKVLRSKVNK